MKNVRLNELDLLRFIAALAVVFFHYAFRGSVDGLSPLSFPGICSFTKYGYYGVHLFFIISGFVILMSASKGGVKNFIVSRFVRLYPAFWICCSLTFLTTCWMGAPWFEASVNQYLVNMTMLNGFVGVQSIDGVYWTLFVEIRFYILIAALLLMRNIHRIEPVLYLWLFVSSLFEFIEVKFLPFILISDYSAFFIAGCLFYLNFKHGGSAGRYIGLLAALVLAVWQTNQELPKLEQHYGSSFSALLVTMIIGVYFLLMFLVSTNRTGFWRARSWVGVGALTYPLYLLHQKIGFIIFWRLHDFVNNYVLFFSVSTLMIGGAYLVHSFIEKPLSILMRRKIDNAPS